MFKYTSNVQKKHLDAYLDAQAQCHDSLRTLQAALDDFKHKELTLRQTSRIMSEQITKRPPC